jgi:DNA polymerase-1
MVASGLLFPSRRSHKLKELTFEFLNINQNTYDEIIGDEKEKLEMISVEKVGRYCIDDSNTSLKLSGYFKPILKKNGFIDIYESIEMPLVSVLSDMEFNGIRVDTTLLEDYKDKLENNLKGIEKLIIEQAGYELNINSPKQLGELLFDRMKLPISKKTKKTKAYSTDIEVLTDFKDIPVVANIIKYRTWKKLYSTYIVGIQERLDEGHRIHTSFNQSVTATGRLSSSNPNLQNIPVFETDDINIRKLFVSDKNKKLLAVDYSQIELRVLAHFSKDKGLVDAFNKGLDIHSQTANLVFGGNLFMDKTMKRKRAKIINFSIIYGSGAYSLSKELDVSFKEAKEFIDMYFEKYSGVKDFIEETILSAEQSGLVRTMFGRKREIQELKSDVQNIRENGKRMAVNTIIQGSAAEIIKIAMKNIYERIKNTNTKMLLSVHDEIIFEYPVEEEKKIIKIISNEMKNAVKLEVPLEISVKIGMNWGEMLEYTE